MRAGQQVQHPAGPATALPTFDFETYSEAGFVWNEVRQKWEGPDGAPGTKRGLPVVGLKNYVNHPSFKILCLSYDLLDGAGIRTWCPRDADPVALWLHVINGGLLEAWNVNFESTVWNDYCVPVLGWPPLTLAQVVCAMAKSRAHAMPGSLANAGDVLQTVHRKDKDGDRLLKLFSVPRNPTKKNPALRLMPEDEPEDWAKLLDYNCTDVLAEIEISLRIPDLSATERRYWEVDQSINRRGLPVDMTAVDNCIAIVEQAVNRGNAELRQITGGEVSEASEVSRTLKWLHARGMHLDNLQEETLDAVLDKKPAGYDPCYRVLEIRQAIGSAAVKKLYSFKLQSYMGRAHDLYSFFGARTGRWTANGPQPQNMYKGRFDTIEEVETALNVIALGSLEALESIYGEGQAIDVVASCLRSLIAARPGYDLVCSDFSAIESVVTACLAGEQWRIDVFRTHGMIYEASASKTCRMEFGEFVKHRTDSGGVAVYAPDGSLRGIKGGKHHPLRNVIGKFTELSLGFQGWIGALIRFGADEFLSEDEMKRAILDWRAASPTLPLLWGGQTIGERWSKQPCLYGLEGAIISAIKYPGTAFSYRAITYQVENDVLYCRVPSGGLITYHSPRLTPHKRFDWSPDWEVAISYMGWNNNPMMGEMGWVRMDLYGGKATENVVQRVARDIQAEAMCAVEAAEYPVVLHSHDELCAEMPIGKGSVEEFERIVNEMVASLPWAKCDDGTPWPIKMKGGWRKTRYGKWE